MVDARMSEFEISTIILSKVSIMTFVRVIDFITPF
jgi:hypothetical protein